MSSILAGANRRLVPHPGGGGAALATTPRSISTRSRVLAQAILMSDVRCTRSMLRAFVLVVCFSSLLLMSINIFPVLPNYFAC